MDELKRIVVLYGSQTGTCEDVSQRIVMQSRGSNFKCTCMALDDYDVEQLVNEKLVIFICSTTGQGEFPDNMMNFWRFIGRKKLPPSVLTGLQFGVLGLGDSSYTKFNYVAKRLYRRLMQLGAEPIFKLGLADDQHEWGAESVVDGWIVDMWTILSRLHPLSPHFTDPLKFSVLHPRFDVEKVENSDKRNDMASGKKHGPYNKVNPLISIVMENRRMTCEDHFQETRLLVLRTNDDEDASLKYQPGDVVMVQPRNLDSDVDEFLAALHFDGDAPMNFVPVSDDDPAPRIPSPITVRELAKNYLDFKAIPGRTFFQIFALLSNDENEKEKLVELGSLQGTDDRYDYVNRPRRNILEIFADFHKTTSRVTVDNLLDLIPFMRPRAFSIASSPSKHPGEIHILVAVVNYKTRMHKRRTGLCSTFMSKLKIGDSVKIWLKRGGIRFNDQVPNIMIGPGTGIAPFRSAAYDLTAIGKTDSVVFFGCRSSKKDFYFEDEWKELNESVELFTAFSRDQEDKIYVQHIIKQQGELLWKLINSDRASVYVAGNSKQMPEAVRDAFLAIFKEYGSLSDEESMKLYEEMQKTKKYQQETWS